MHTQPAPEEGVYCDPETFSRRPDHPGLQFLPMRTGTDENCRSPFRKDDHPGVQSTGKGLPLAYLEPGDHLQHHHQGEGGHKKETVLIFSQFLFFLKK